VVGLLVLPVGSEFGSPAIPMEALCDGVDAKKLCTVLRTKFVMCVRNECLRVVAL